jgi:hypothetical protein
LAEFDLRQFEPSDAGEIQLQSYMEVPSDPKVWEAAASGGDCFTGRHDGRIIVCSGIVRHWQTRAEAWLLMGCPVSRTEMLWIHRRVSDFLENAGIVRIETTVKQNFDAGHRWAKMLGFKAEGRMSRFGPDGTDYQMYARV